MRAAWRRVVFGLLLFSPAERPRTRLDYAGWAIADVQIGDAGGGAYERAVDQSFERWHGAALEHVAADLRSQSFWFGAQAARAGLSVRLRLENARVVAVEPTHATLDTPQGRLRYGPVYLFDADGVRTALPLRGDGALLWFTADPELLARSRPPLVIDPWLSPEVDLDAPIPVDVTGFINGLVATDAGWLLTHIEPSLIGGARLIAIDRDGAQRVVDPSSQLGYLGSDEPGAPQAVLGYLGAGLLAADGGVAYVPCAGSCFAASSRRSLLVGTASMTDAGTVVSGQLFDTALQPKTPKLQLGGPTPVAYPNAVWTQGHFDVSWVEQPATATATIHHRTVEDDGGLGAELVISAAGWFGLVVVGTADGLMYATDVSHDGGPQLAEFALPPAGPRRLAGPLEWRSQFTSAPSGFLAAVSHDGGVELLSIALDGGVSQLLLLPSDAGLRTERLGESSGELLLISHATSAPFFGLTHEFLQVNLLPLDGGPTFGVRPLLSTVNAEFSPAIAWSGDRFMVRWEDDVASTGGFNRHVWQAQLSADGGVRVTRALVDGVRILDLLPGSYRSLAPAAEGWNTIIPGLAWPSVAHVLPDASVERVTDSTSFGTYGWAALGGGATGAVLTFWSTPFSPGVWGRRFGPSGAPIDAVDVQLVTNPNARPRDAVTLAGDHLILLEDASDAGTLDLLRWPADGGAAAPLQLIDTPDGSYFYCAQLQCSGGTCVMMRGTLGEDLALYSLGGTRLRSLAPPVVNCPRLFAEAGRFHVLGVMFDGGSQALYGSTFTADGAAYGLPWSLPNVYEFDLAGDDDGGALLAYTVPAARISQLRVRSLSWRATAEPCVQDGECVSGFCVDGVCCADACGGGNPMDCEACSITAGAPADGTCGVVAAGRMCRAAVNVCDDVERCDGTLLTCPPDPGPRPGCDAGSPEPDGGAPDAGAPDAGEPDAGIASPAALAVRCGCSADPRALLVSLSLLVAARRRRR